MIKQVQISHDHIQIEEESNMKQIKDNLIKTTYESLDEGNFFSKIILYGTFKYCTKINKDIFQYNYLLTLQNMPQLLKSQDLRSDELSNMIFALKNEEITPYNIIKQIFKIHKWQIIVVTIAMIIFQQLKVLGNIILNMLIESYVQNEIGNALGLAALAIFINIIYVCFFMHAMNITAQLNTQIRLEIIEVLYKKVLKLNQYSIQKANLGKLINIIANDMNSIENRAQFLFYLITTPFFLCFVLYVLWARFGAYSLLGILTLYIANPIQQYISRNNMQNYKARNKSSDERVRLSNELIEGIRLIKMYGWENAFKQIIDQIRNLEQKSILRIQLGLYIDRTMSVNGGYFASLALFSSYYLAGNHLDISHMFATIQLLEFVRQNGILFIGYGIQIYYEIKVILNRILEILKVDSQEWLLEQDNDQPKYLKIENYSASWEDNANSILKNINLEVKSKNVIAVIGPVGSGKSSLLQAILNEIPIVLNGSINRNGKLALTEQEPFIFGGTVQSNILFGLKMDIQKYNNIIQLCQLIEDINNFNQGDQTEIGEKGINLSGGQKARVCLARALYSDADIFLFDDPLSALDAKICRKIFDDVFKGFLKDKLVILVTHQLQFLNQVDMVVYMQNGSIVKQVDDISQIQQETIVRKIPEQLENKVMMMNEINSKMIINEEEQNTKPSFNTYKNYFKQANQPKVIGFIIFLSLWAEATRFFIYRCFGYIADPSIETSKILLLCFGLSILLLLLRIVKYILAFTVILQANKNVHSRMVEGILRSPQQFFDQNPSGNILNRFSNDLSIMDNLIIQQITDNFELILYQISLIVTISVIAPYFLIVAMVLFSLYYQIFKIFQMPIKELKRLDLINKGIIFHHFSNSMNGIQTIKVFRQDHYFINHMKKILKNYASCNYTFWSTTRCFALYIELTANLFALFGIFILILFVKNQQDFSQSLIYLIIMCEFIQWIMRQLLTLDIFMNSVQRTLQYVDLPYEGDLKKNTDLQLTKWPNKGEIQFKNVRMRYRQNSELVLKGLNFIIKGSEKIGVIGRTGAGKSSIIQCIFRMVKAEHGSQIIIDDQEISNLGLHTLRQNISIIPQNPFLFSGTIRRNLDPLNCYNDDQIWEVLRDVNLREYVESMELKLDTDMTVTKSVFSVGQKQLICLARAILKKNKILLLDEATANVDQQTDEFIQAKIKEKFYDCTIITIAHRLLTIADYDKVLVLDKGIMVEYGSPYELLVEDKDQNIKKQGYLASMVQSCGYDMKQRIFKIAQEKYHSQK